MTDQQQETDVNSNAAKQPEVLEPDRRDIEPPRERAELAQAERPAPRAQVVRDIDAARERGMEQASVISIVRHTPDIGDLFGALAAAQGEFGDIERILTAKIQSSKANYEYDYAPLDVVLQAVRPALSKQGLAIMQFPLTRAAQHGASVVIRTMLGHKSGQWLYNDLTVAADGTMPREIGSAITYARRYAIMSLLGVAPAHDDDGVAAEGPRAANPPRPAQRRSERPAQPAEAPAEPEPPRKADPPRKNKMVQGELAAVAERPEGAIVTVSDGAPQPNVVRLGVTDPRMVDRLNAAVGRQVVLEVRPPQGDPKKFLPIVERVTVAGE